MKFITILFGAFNVIGKRNYQRKFNLRTIFNFKIVATANVLTLSNDDETAFIDKSPKEIFRLSEYKFCKMVVTLVRGQIEENTPKVRLTSTLFTFLRSSHFFYFPTVFRNELRKFSKENAHRWPNWKSFDQFVEDWPWMLATIL